MTTKRDYYDVLEVGRSASEEDIRKVCSGNFLRVWSEIEKASESS